MAKPRGGEICERIGVLSAQMHAATAELVRLAAELDDDGAWADIGVRTCAHWLSITTGVDVWTGGEMIRSGHALTQLPKIAEAFADGRLSFDKVRAVSRVAVPEDEDTWLEVALQASGAQLSRICRAVRRALDADDPAGADDALANRGVRVWWRDDGMLELMAVLPREDGAVVMAAIEAVAHDIVSEQPGVRQGARAPLDPARLTQPTLRADALVRICDTWIANASSEPIAAPTRQMVVHVDATVLVDGDPGGRSHIEDGPWLPGSAVRWLACDADVVRILERDGLPVDVGRTRRLISPRLRLALQARDKGCRFPGCAVPAPRAEGHHIRHWANGGRTDMANLVSLCRFHHRRHHEGKFEIRATEGGHVRFEACDGTPLLPMSPRAAVIPHETLNEVSWDTARARDGGEEVADFPYAVSVIADSCRFRRGWP